ncbi:hypothetical protein AB0D08_06810 [Kitasatospora sp. NPDC048540]|uniref:hypothetical protein n=1 Tax=Kitasatospora sp. NPDC048540 TaxID=3155634 RepID=UPI0033C02869
MAGQLSTRDLSEQRARLMAALLEHQRHLNRTIAQGDGLQRPVGLQRHREGMDLLAAQLRSITAEIEGRTAAAAGNPAPRPRMLRGQLAERQNAQTWHHRRQPLGDRTQGEQRGTA